MQAIRKTKQKKVIAAASRVAKGMRKPPQSTGNAFLDAVALAEHTGLLKGAKTRVIRGRMPEALVEEAKAKAGVESDTRLIEVALANLAVADKFAAWLLSQRGTLPKDLDLEF